MDDPAICIREAQRAARSASAHVHDREDLSQEALLRVWRRVRAGVRPGSLKALLRRTLAGLVVDQRRREQPDLTDDLQTRVAADASPADILHSAEREQRVRRAIQGLPPLQRDVVRRRYYEGLKFREIAETLDVPLNTVLGRMHLATRRLRSVLENDHD